MFPTLYMYIELRVSQNWNGFIDIHKQKEPKRRGKCSQFSCKWRKASATPRWCSLHAATYPIIFFDPSVTEIIFMDFHACHIASSNQRVNKQILELSNALLRDFVIVIAFCGWEDDFTHYKRSHLGVAFEGD